MKRAGLMVAVAVLLVGAFVPDAEAQRRRGGQAATPAPPREPTEPNANIVALMNGLTWGMSRDQVIAVVKEEIKQKYWPQIQAVQDDAVAEQNLRNRMERDQQKVVDSCVKFDGQETPWNVSMVDQEFTHNNQEEMCKYDRGDSVDFYFFIRGKLWKIFRSLGGQLATAPPTFDDMRAQMEAQFGPGEPLTSLNEYTLVTTTYGVKWIDSQTEMQLRWLDLYGVFAIVLTERATLGNLSNLRRATATTTQRPGTGLTQAVTEGVPTDENADIVQRIRGQRPDPNAPTTR